MFQSSIQQTTSKVNNININSNSHNVYYVKKIIPLNKREHIRNRDLKLYEERVNICNEKLYEDGGLTSLEHRFYRRYKFELFNRGENAFDPFKESPIERLEHFKYFLATNIQKGFIDYLEKDAQEDWKNILQISFENMDWEDIEKIYSIFKKYNFVGDNKDLFENVQDFRFFLLKNYYKKGGV